MDPSRHERVSELFLAACELPESERPGFLTESCEGDAELRAEVEQLLAADAGEVAVDRSPAKATWAAKAFGEVGSAAHPETLGEYQVLGVLGEGGMGIVYRARQKRPERDVALKVVRAGLATDAMLRRFEVEAALLGRLRHPGIAQIFEAGVADTPAGAQPFFAMELVEGRTLTEWIREASPTTDQRIALLAEIADAVAHAHQRGIAHRDLKPSNILVDAHDRPRILDFGVARAVDDETLDEDSTLLTRTGQLVGTLHYMSPEQVSGDPSSVDVRTDVYSLGVVGFEMLVGQRPLKLDGLPLVEAARHITSTDPDKLGALDRALRGDIEVIVAKALEKDKDRRYGSAGELALDLRRLMADEPIEARPASTVYQLTKLARRNRALVGGSAIGLVALLVGLAAALVQAKRATASAELAAREAERATRAAEEAALESEKTAAALSESDAVVDFLSRLLQSVHPDQLGREVRVNDVLDAAAGRIENELAGRPSVQARVADAIGRSWITLGESERGRVALTLASARFEESYGKTDPRTIGAKSQLATAYAYLARDEEAQELLVDTIAAAHEAFGPDSIETIDLQATLGGILLNLERPADAEAILSEAVELGARVAPGDTRRLEHIENLAQARRLLGRFAASLDLTRDAYAHAVETLGPDHWRTLRSAASYGLELHANAHFQETIDLLEPTVERMTEVFGAHHPETLRSTEHLALAYLEIPRFEQARALLESTAAQHASFYGEDHPVTLLSRRYLLQVLMRSREDAAGLELALDVTAGFERAHGPLHPSTIEALAQVGELHDRLNELDEAEAALSEAVARARETLPRTDVTRIQATVSLAGLLHKLGRSAEALETIDATLAGSADVVGEVGIIQYHTMAVRGRILVDMGRPDEGLAQLTEAIAGLTEVAGPASPITLDVEATFVRALRELGNGEDAVVACAAARERAFESHGLESYQAVQLSVALAKAMNAAGDAETARLVLEEHLEDTGPDFPERDSDALALLDQLAILHDTSGRTEESLAVRTRALDAMKKHYGESHANVVVAEYNVGRILTQLGRYEEAEEQLRAGMSHVAGARLGVEWPARLAFDLGRTLIAAGEPERALEVLEVAHGQAQDVEGLDAVWISRLEREMDRAVEALDP